MYARIINEFNSLMRLQREATHGLELAINYGLIHFERAPNLTYMPLSFLGSVALQKAKVRLGSPHICITRIKYSSPAHRLIAVADLDGTLTVHDAQDLTIIRRKTVSQSGSSPNTIQALEWHPKESEVYVGFSNGNVIGYDIDKDMRSHTKDPYHRLSFDGPIYNIAFSPSGSQFAVAYGEQVKIIKQRSFGKYHKHDLGIWPRTNPQKLFYYETNSLVVISLLNLPNNIPAAVAYSTDDSRPGTLWTVFTTASDTM
ncbi:Lethal(2) giant larvae sro7 [Pleurotus ostreatus]|nr:Lethal(2) giant larvae sro7 [Pleurotus ostreatus]